MKYSEVKLTSQLEKFLRSKGLLRKFKRCVVCDPFYASSIVLNDLNVFWWHGAQLRLGDVRYYWLNLDNQFDEWKKE